ncbi:hypothetical protein K491DRAFT_57180 [Lophiostoma macrostomum CBS 122681]|uniref:Uncharacterized protein n=1 Tax=Lophiostoma macrostomum CBS 122681 TaxID=1314788 RepID=A0A6A6TLU5_9PLEO|nr:hypothetical protein K491DRAFT_57180 [Lophiostoma macrostomum CBS 122681]
MPPKADANANAAAGPAATAAAGTKQRRKPERIVPAIPYALMKPLPWAPHWWQRPAMPSKADETAAEQVTQQPSGLPPAGDQKTATPPIEEPVTPQSKASEVVDGLVGLSSPGLAETPQDTATDTAAAAHPVDELQETLPEPLDELSVAASETTQTPSPAQQQPSLEAPEHSPSPPQASAGATASSSSSVANSASHKARQSLDGIVFGARQDTPAMPPSPHEPAPAVRPAQAPHNSLPGFGGHQSAAPFHPGHSQHLSGHHVSWPTHALPLDPPPPPTNDPYWNHLHGQSSPPNSVTLANGASRSHSRSPGIPQLGSRGSVARSIGQDLQFMNSPRDTRPNQQATVDWVLTHFGNPDQADCVLRVRSDAGVLLNLPAIRFIITRSPTIAAMARNRGALVPQADGSPPVIDIFTLDEFVTPTSLVEAAKVLYGAPSLPMDLFVNGLGPFHPDDEQSPSLTDARNRMSQAISYAAAVRLFGLSSVFGHGIQMIKTLMRWDTIDLAVAFSLSMDFHSAGQQSIHPHHGVPVSPDEYYAATALYTDCVEFIASDFPFRFHLDTIAPELKNNPRLPNVIEQPAHNSRLSWIRFGDVPPEDELKPNYVTRTLSSIFLTLPLPMADDILNNINVVGSIGAGEVERIMRDVVAERERRRDKVIRHRGDLQGGLPKTLVNSMFYEEQVVRSKLQRSGFSLISLYTVYRSTRPL